MSEVTECIKLVSEFAVGDRAFFLVADNKRVWVQVEKVETIYTGAVVVTWSEPVGVVYYSPRVRMRVVCV